MENFSPQPGVDTLVPSKSGTIPSVSNVILTRENSSSTHHKYNDVIEDKCSSSTLSLPIRIPGRRGTSAVQNVDASEGNQDTSPVRPHPHVNKVELVKCDHIVIHVGSPEPSSSSAPIGNRLHCRAHNKADHRLFVPEVGWRRERIGSAPNDLRDLRGENIIRHKHRCRKFSTDNEDCDGSSPNAGIPRLILPDRGIHFQRPRRGQTLISFLESFASTNSNELEWENVHFTICQAVICALEQVKWANRRRSADESDDNDNGDEIIDNDAQRDDVDLLEATDPQLMTGDSGLIPVSNSAESCGLALLSNIQNLPEASVIPWGGLDGGCRFDGKTYSDWSLASFYRGTNNWAPPRPQIIFTKNCGDHNRKNVLLEQNYRCRGCGCAVSQENSHTFRLCCYTSQYYCTVCHRNQLSVIPARVLGDWDFKLFPVSVSSYRLLEDIWYSPLFNLSAINGALFNRVPLLKCAEKARASLRMAQEHISSCRFYKESDKDFFCDMPDYITTDLELWSMADLKAVKRGGLVEYIKQFLDQCNNHVLQCELCLARGYLCEFCHNDEILFPWMRRVHMCSACRSCYHNNCWNVGLGHCSRCARIRQRK